MRHYNVPQTRMLLYAHRGESDNQRDQAKGMKVTEINLDPERQALCDIILSLEVANGMASEFPNAPTLWTSGWMRTLCRWIWDYLPHAGETAPVSALPQILQSNQGTLPEADSQAITDLLKSLSDTAASRPPRVIEYAQEQARKTLGICVAKRLKDRLEGAIASGDLASVEKALDSYTKPGRKGSGLVSMFSDADLVLDALTAEDDTLFTLPGALGELVGPIIRGDFIAPMAPAKGKKSWMVDLLAIRAALAGCHVLVCDFELVKKQKARRLWRHLVGRPATSRRVDFPTFKGGEIVHLSKDCPGVDLNRDAIRKVMQGLAQVSKGGCLDFENFPNSGASLLDVEAVMKEHKAATGRDYDFVVIDSADYLDSRLQSKETRHNLNDNWMRLRGLGQKYNIAVCSPSHTNFKGSAGGGASESNVSEESRKLNHITKSLVLNSTAKEREMGIMRVSTSVSRDNGTRDDQVVVLQCLDVARPYLDSRWLSDVHSDLVFRPKELGGKFGKDLD